MNDENSTKKLKAELDGIENQQHKLQREMTQLNEKIAKCKMKLAGTPQPRSKFFNKA